MFSLFRRPAQVRRPRSSSSLAAGLVRQLEKRTLMAGISYSSNATSITVIGTADGETIDVSAGPTNFLVNGVDTLIPHAGKTKLIVNASGGADTIILDASLTGIITSSALNGGAGADTISGGASNDAVVIDQFDVIGDMGAGTDSLNASTATGALNLVLAGTNVESVEGSGFDDFIDGSSLTTNVTIVGGNGNDTIYGGSGNDLIRGKDGDDSIKGGAGNDNLYGDAGEDSLDGEDNDDVLFFDSTDVAVNFGSQLIGGTGFDVIRMVSFVSPGITLVLSDANGLERVHGTESADIIDASAVTTSLDIRAYAGDDLIKGGTAGDQILAGAGNDTVLGGDGNDSIAGQAGNDSLVGGNGIDMISYYDSQAAVTVDLNIHLTSNDGLSGGVDTLSSIENVTGSDFDDSLTGDSLANELIGGKGNDTLVGRDGADILQGGIGNDSLNGGNGADSLYGGAGNDILNGGAGTDLNDGGDNDDLVYADSTEDDVAGNLLGGSGTDTLRPQDATLPVTWGIGSAGFESIIGTNFADSIDLTGSNENVTVLAANGDDTIVGGNGNDSINGGTGNDKIDGGAGNDTLLGGDNNDTLVGGAGADSIRGGSGDDKLYAYLVLAPNDTASDGFQDFLLGDAGTDEYWANVTTDNDSIISAVGEIKHTA
ncbi:MAG: calcium-binding protein [Planctomycetaceae bacterium]